MTSQRCEICVYGGENSEIVCVNCRLTAPAGFPFDLGPDVEGWPLDEQELDAQAYASAALDDVAEVALRVQDPVSGISYDFRVSIEDEGVMFCREYGGPNCVEQDPSEENESAWAALDAVMGFDVRVGAVDKGIGSTSPPFMAALTVAYAVLPFELALLISRRLGRR